MPICMAIRISSALPFLFTPVTYQTKTYVDGGLLANLPVGVFDSSVRAIAFVLTTQDPHPPITHFGNYASSVFWTLKDRANGAQLTADQLARVDQVHIDTTGINSFDFHMKHHDRMMLHARAYDASRKSLMSHKKCPTDAHTRAAKLVSGTKTVRTAADESRR